MPLSLPNSGLSLRFETDEKCTRLFIWETKTKEKLLSVVETDNVLDYWLTRLYLGSFSKQLLSRCDPVELDRELLGLR